LAVLLLAAVLATLVSGCGGGGTKTIVLPAYLYYCLVDGKVVRWTRMPIKIYMDTTDVPDNWSTSFRDAFVQAASEWCDASGGLVRVEFISEPVTPCIRVKWVHDTPMGHAEAIGVTRFTTVTYYGNTYFDNVYMELATTDMSTGQPYSQERARITSLHELGHALGLWGHSTNINDIMYGSGTIVATAISYDDARCIKKLYELPADISEVPAGYRARASSTIGFEIE
jgi:predicted Zn-dependent protease